MTRVDLNREKRSTSESFVQENAPGARGIPLLSEAIRRILPRSARLSHRALLGGTATSCCLQSFGMPFYMFNDPDHIEEILRHKHRLFKKDFYVVSLEPLLGNGLLTSDGEAWADSGRWRSRHFRPGKCSNMRPPWSNTHAA